MAAYEAAYNAVPGSYSMHGYDSALLIDSDTASGWNARGIAVDGDRSLRGQKLAPIVVDDELYWPVMKYWYPHLERGAILPADVPQHSNPSSSTRPTRSRRR